MVGEQQKKIFTGRMFLASILGFFTLVIGVNMIMAYFALDTFSGLETEDAYVKGRDYNDEIGRKKTQAALGWTVAFTHSTPQPGKLILEALYRDSAGAGVTALSVKAALRRPARSDLDQALMLLPDGLGRYVGVVDLTADGRWYLRLDASLQTGQTYRSEHELWVNPVQKSNNETSSQ